LAKVNDEIKKSAEEQTEGDADEREEARAKEVTVVTDNGTEPQVTLALVRILSKVSKIRYSSK
jgi:hypothetical protein